MCEHARSMGHVPSDKQHSSLHVPVFVGLRELFGALRDNIDPTRRSDPEYVAQISRLLETRNLNRDEWGVHINFQENRYTRTLVAHDENFTALLLCWNKGQKSPIHDHAGSNCWVKVLSGNLRERRFSFYPEVKELSDQLYPTSGVTYIDDTMAYHEMSNPSLEEGCVSLHIYSPPYYYCHAYEPGGTGVKDVAMIAINAPRKGVPSDIVLNRGFSSDDATSLKGISLKRFITDCVAAKSNDDLLSAFSAVRLLPCELDVMANFSDFKVQRILLHNDANASVMLACWLPGQSYALDTAAPSSPASSTPTRASTWMRVVAGSLCDNASGDVVSVTPGSTIVNRSDRFAIALLLFAPSIDPEVAKAVYSELLTPTSQCLFSNETQLISGLNEQLTTFPSQSSTSDVEEAASNVMSLLQDMEFTDADVDRYVNNRQGHRIFVCEGENFNVVLNIWEPGQSSVVHDHVGSHSWIRIIRGQLVDLEYTIPEDETQPGKVARSTILRRGCVEYSDPSMVHAQRNQHRTESCVSLHVYSPPCTECTWYSLGVNVKRSSSRVSSISTSRFHQQCCPKAKKAATERCQAALGDGDHFMWWSCML